MSVSMHGEHGQQLTVPACERDTSVMIGSVRGICCVLFACGCAGRVTIDGGPTKQVLDMGWMTRGVFGNADDTDMHYSSA